MRMKLHLLSILIFLGYSAVCQESTELLFMNGKELRVLQFNDSSQSILTYQFDKNYFKRERINLREARKQDVFFTTEFRTAKGDSVPVVLREGQMERDQLYSSTSQTGTEKVFYALDEPNGDFLTESEMRAFVVGERDARYGVRGRFWLISGFAVGAISGYAMKSSVYALAVPPLFSLSAQIPVVKIKQSHISDNVYYENEDYASGYASHARSKYTREALKGSVLGLLVGIVTYAIVDNN